ncbi:cytochrome P450 2C15-like isoform X1 [Styela clava]
MNSFAVIALIVVVCVISVYLLCFLLSKARKLIKFLYKLSLNPCKALRDVGLVSSFQYGGQMWFILNDFNSIIRALKRGNMCSGRPKLHFLQKWGGECGIAFIDGNIWEIHRKIATKSINRFLGDRAISTIRNECERLVQYIDDLQDNPVDCEILLMKAIANITCDLVMRKRFGYDDSEFSDLIQRTILNQSSRLLGGIIFFPILQYAPFFRSSYVKFFSTIDLIKNMFKKVIRQRTEEQQNEIHPKCFVDYFLRDMPGVNTAEKENRLVQCCFELFGAGTETTATTLTWCILGLVHFPLYQERILGEILDVTGHNELPTIHQIQEMHFTRAFIQEIMRYHPAAPITLRRTMSSFNLNKQNVNENSNVLVNIWAVHHDKDHFQNPGIFRPERFLDSSSHFIVDHHVMPFSVGSRACPGFQLAKIEIALVLISLLQSFQIASSTKKSLTPFEERTFGLVCCPKPFEVLFKRRL